MKKFVAATPYDFPFDGSLHPSSTALVAIDMQRDFLDEGGYVHAVGYDLAPMRRTVAPTRAVFDVLREHGYLIIHTRAGRRPDMSDVPEVRRFRSQRAGADYGATGPLGRFLVRGEPGHQIVSELQPLDDEPVIDKPSSSAFYATELELILTCRNIRSLIFVGLTTDICVHSSLRSAIDRGFDCLLLKDCTAATVEANYLAAIDTITTEGGYFGAVSDSKALIVALSQR